MLEKLKRFREPVAWTLVAATGLQIVLALVAFIYYLVTTGAASAGYLAAYQLTGTLVIVGAVVIGSCAYWGATTPRARLLALIAAAEYLVLAVLQVIFALIGAIGGNSVFSMVGLILETAAPVLAAVVLYAIAGSVPATARQRALPGPPPDWGPPPQQPGARGWNGDGGVQPQGGWHQPAGPAQQGSHRQPGEPPQPGYRPPGWSQQPGGLPGNAPGRPPGPGQWAGQPHPGWRQVETNPPSRSDQFAGQAPNRGANSAGYSGPVGAGPADRWPERPEQRSEQPAWRPAPQQPPERLQPAPDQSPVGPHNPRAAAEVRPARAADPWPADEPLLPPAGSYAVGTHADQDQHRAASGPAGPGPDRDDDHGPRTPSAPQRR